VLFFRFGGPLAQSVEHLSFKQGVAGSSPARLMSNISRLGGSVWPAFFHVHTVEVWWFRLDSTTLWLTVAGAGLLRIAVDD
jgi:hypothetical protein